MTLFPEAQEVTDPTVIIVQQTDASISIESLKLTGQFVRVRPKTPLEIFSIRGMEMYSDKWAEAEKNGGTILTREAYKNAR